MTNLVYPSQLDDNVVRAVASFTFAISLTMFLEPTLSFLIYPLALDFVLRWVHPRFSPLARVMKVINIKVVGNKPIPVFSPPKRFAVLIGVVMTSAMSIFHLLGIALLFQIFLVFLLIASGLQAWFDYCLGCTVYDMLIGMGLVGRSKSVDNFMGYLQQLNGPSQPVYSSNPEVLRSQLSEVVSGHGILSEESVQLIDQIVASVSRYSRILAEAREDGIITEEERRRLYHDRNDIVRRAYQVAQSDGKVTRDEKDLLTLLYDILEQKSMLVPEVSG